MKASPNEVMARIYWTAADEYDKLAMESPDVHSKLVWLRNKNNAVKCAEFYEAKAAAHRSWWRRLLGLS